MSEINLNNELTMSCPEGFHILGDAEKRNMQMLKEGEWTGISDPERHILVSCGWEKPGFASVILKARDIADVSEKRARKALTPMDYRLECRNERMIAGEEACSFRYVYTVQDIPMCGETYALRLGKLIYYFNFYCRQALRDDSLPVWQDLLDSVKKI